MRTRILLVFLTSCLISGSVPAISQKPSFQFLQKSGPYPVGLKVIDQYDRSRTYPAFPKESSKPSARESARPLQTLVWYPSLNRSGTAMTVGGYVKLADTELNFASPDEGGNRWRSRLKTSFDTPLWAVQDAKAADGHYPILIYAPSDSAASWENADLCEYLASQGYVVLASPSMGASTRDMTDDLEGINAQARDISFLITYANSLPDADPTKVAVVSWSYGGISSLFAAARDPRIDALISMDGSMRYYPGLVQRADDVHSEQMTIPLLFFTQGDLSLERLAQDDAPAADRTGPNVLNAWVKGDLFTVHMLGMSHPEFSSMSQRRKTAQTYEEDQVADYGRDDTNTGYAWVALYTRNFLNGYLKADASAMSFLERTPAENGVPRHFMKIAIRRAQKATPTDN